MNLYFRLFLTLLRCLWRPALTPGDRTMFQELVDWPMPVDVAQWREAEQSMIELARERALTA